MSEHYKFLISVHFLAAVVIIFCVKFSTEYWDSHNAKVADLVKNGVSPVEAMCALQDDFGKNPTCVIIASKEKWK